MHDNSTFHLIFTRKLTNLKVQKYLISILKMNRQSVCPSWQGFRGERGVLWARECHPSEAGEHVAGCPGWGNPQPNFHLSICYSFEACLCSLSAVVRPTLVAIVDRRPGLSWVHRRLEAQLWQATVDGSVQLLLLPQQGSDAVLTCLLRSVNVFN